MPKIIATKEDWINLGYKLFSEMGISGIVVEKMAKKLKVNKSSFYWHFKTKKEFINEIISFWVSIDTTKIISMVESESNPIKKFDKLIQLVFKKDPFFDFIFYLKRYALKNKSIQTLIDNIDNQRIEYTKNIIIEMNYSLEEATIYASLFYKYLIGYHEMIRYKKQSKHYTSEVKTEINQFIKY